MVEETRQRSDAGSCISNFHECVLPAKRCGNRRHPCAELHVWGAPARIVQDTGKVLWDKAKIKGRTGYPSAMRKANEIKK